MSAATPTIRYEVAGPLARITLANAARHNAMTLQMWQSLPDAIAKAVADNSVRLIVLSGEGEKAFCAGADISEFGTARSSSRPCAWPRAAGSTGRS